MKTTKDGFTLIELMVVVIIIGILAAIAAPLGSAMKVRAICTEAVTIMGTIRTAMRTYYAIYGDYPYLNDVNIFATNNDYGFESMGLLVDDLKGAYFGKECYAVRQTGLESYRGIYAYPYPQPWGGGINSAPRAEDANNAQDEHNGAGWLKMDINTGRVTNGGMSKSGYPVI